VLAIVQISNHSHFKLSRFLSVSHAMLKTIIPSLRPRGYLFTCNPALQLGPQGPRNSVAQSSPSGCWRAPTGPVCCQQLQGITSWFTTPTWTSWICRVGAISIFPEAQYILMRYLGNLLVIFSEICACFSGIQIQGIMPHPRSSWKHSGGPRQMGRWCSWQWTLGTCTINLSAPLEICRYTMICWYTDRQCVTAYLWNAILQMTIHVLVVLWYEFTWLAPSKYAKSG
jgi:hypothetical protein